MRIIFSGIILLSFFLSSCSTQKEVISELPADAEFYWYEFVYEGEQEQLKKEKINFAGKVSREVVLDTLLIRLSEKFSRDWNEMKNPGVKFERESINKIQTTSADYFVSVINIIDKNNIMERTYFQGSSGGLITQRTILINILQPQQENFMDGCIIHINGKPVEVMDHVNLRGIIVTGS